jgi:hypothetical protein
MSTRPRGGRENRGLTDLLDERVSHDPVGRRCRRLDLEDCAQARPGANGRDSTVEVDVVNQVADASECEGEVDGCRARVRPVLLARLSAVYL